MKMQRLEFTYEWHENAESLTNADKVLLGLAKEACALAYAPYSRFQVGAVAELINGMIIKGANQENASFPAGLCAERVLLAAISSTYPQTPIKTIAISYRGNQVVSNHPISPCGICRQSLVEYEEHFQQTIRLILGGMEGNVYIIPSASILLPFSFSRNDLK